MNITVKDKEVELSYAFNSFKYMEELDINALGELGNKPFKIIGTAEILLLGALNHNPSKVFKASDVQECLEKAIVDATLIDLVTDLVELLQESDFFKSLQVSNVETL